MLILWLAYQLANWVAPCALSNLSLCDPSPRQQLIAFWAPFLLHHLGGPDNISAFSLEDNALSGREALTVFSQIGGASYVLYKHVYIGSGGGGGSLIPASIIVFVVGAAKYVERAFALWQSDLGNIRSSRKKEKQPNTSSCSDLLITMGCHHLLLDEEALLVAHQMLPFCKRAMSDSSVDADDHDLDRSRKIFTLRWENMCSVVEMELSLMYDIMYTKVAVVHTWHGCFLRIVTPLAIAAAIVLFACYNIEDQAIPDVIITYTLLVGTFLLDTRWLLRALGSTWMHAFLQVSRLTRAFFGIGRWHRLRGALVSLDVGRLRLMAPPSSPGSYRRWSGKVGQYSLLHEGTRGISRCSRAAKKIVLEDVWKEHQHSNTCKLSEEVKQAVFTRVTEVLRSTYEEANMDGRYSMRDITTSWGQLTAKRYKEEHAKGDEEEEFHLAFGREFQEDILVWHIATKVFLVSDEQGKLYAGTKHARAIKALSEYLMFLVAVRRHMLPGLMLRSLYERTFESLQRVWSNERGKARSSSTTIEEQKLAQILLGDKQGDSDWGLDDVKTSIVSDGVNLAMELLRADESEMPQLLELVFNLWVDKLLHAAVSCSTESHAKQLSRGGDFTTIVWIMAQHAGPFQIGQQGPDYNEKSEDEIEEKHPDKTVTDILYYESHFHENEIAGLLNS
ncbi:hypothetical protein ZWY2020_026464 [Hordeum vulgare]|nr:hypothetical protein ZWY2020_026464 [Hordeum vulgare]